MSPIEGDVFYPPQDPWGGYFWEVLKGLDGERAGQVRRAIIVADRYQGFLPIILERYSSASRILLDGSRVLGAPTELDEATLRKEMKTSSRASAEAQLQIESFHLFAKAFCDRVISAMGVVLTGRIHGVNTRSVGGFAHSARPHLDSWSGIDEVLQSIAALADVLLWRHTVFAHDDGARGIAAALATSFPLDPPARSSIAQVFFGEAEGDGVSATRPLHDIMGDIERFLGAAGSFLWANAPPDRLCGSNA